MAGKRLLPLLGGSSSVWITCLVFFQTALLVGYLCAHGIATRLRPRMQTIIYGLLLLVSLAQVVRSLKPDLRASTVHPIFSVLWLLTVLIGLPFLVLSATNPLLQAWYARGDQTPPYKLFALSNLGSLLALVSYPALVEPYFSLHAQTVAWSMGFLVFVLVCGAISLRAGETARVEPKITRAQPDTSSDQAKPPTSNERMLWLFASACGALLLSAVTNHLSQNIAAIPLLWIIPLTIYLLTFVIAFDGRLYFRWPMVGFLAVTLLSVGYESRPDVAYQHCCPVLLHIFIYCLPVLPWRVVSPQAGAALCHSILFVHCRRRSARLNICGRAGAAGLSWKL